MSDGPKPVPRTIPAVTHMTFPEGAIPRAITYMHEMAAQGRADAYLKAKGAEGAANVVFVRPSEKEQTTYPFLEDAEELWMVYGPVSEEPKR